MSLPTQNPSDPRRIVLDTNVVLDWLVFRDPWALPLGELVEAGRLQWIATDAMRRELAHVLGRGIGSAWLQDPAALWRLWDRLVRTEPDPPPPGEASRLRCTDADDQKFIDLALARAHFLVSRDRAVLKLARRARPLGLQVLSPTTWSAAMTC